MKKQIQPITLLLSILINAQFALAQYSGGSFGGFTSSRSDDILYDGTTPAITGNELPDVVHNLTIDNSAGVTLTKSITVIGDIQVLNGDFDLNGNEIKLGDFATVSETPGNTIFGGVGGITTTQDLGDLRDGKNVGGMGLVLKSVTPLGETVIVRGHASQEITSEKLGANRFFDVDPTIRDNLDVEVEFHYDESELSNIPENDLALFIQHGILASGQPILAKGAIIQQQGNDWQLLGGTVDTQSNAVCKGGIPDFSRLTIGRGFVILASEEVEIKGNVFSEGEIHCNNDIEFKKGEPGSHKGNLTAVDDIKIKRENTIDGNALAGDELSISEDATVTGMAAEQPVAAILLPEFSFAAGGENKIVPKNGTLTLAPGTYGNVEVGKKATLFLSAGDYFVNTLDFDDKALLSIDVSAGPVNVNIVHKLEFDDKSTVEITPFGIAATSQVAFATLQKSKVEIGKHTTFLGWLYAPSAKVEFEKESLFKGSVVARKVELEDRVQFFSHGFDGALPKRTGEFEENEEIENEIQETITSYELLQNYPNPFNASTIISFNIPEEAHVKLAIYDATGRLVRTLTDRFLPVGKHSIVWNGTASDGRVVATGMYFYRLESGSFVARKKLLLVK